MKTLLSLVLSASLTCTAYAQAGSGETSAHPTERLSDGETLVRIGEGAVVGAGVALKGLDVALKRADGHGLSDEARRDFEYESHKTARKELTENDPSLKQKLAERDSLVKRVDFAESERPHLGYAEKIELDKNRIRLSELEKELGDADLRLFKRGKELGELALAGKEVPANMTEAAKDLKTTRVIGRVASLAFWATAIDLTRRVAGVGISLPSSGYSPSIATHVTQAKKAPAVVTSEVSPGTAMDIR